MALILQEPQGGEGAHVGHDAIGLPEVGDHGSQCRAKGTGPLTGSVASLTDPLTAGGSVNF